MTLIAIALGVALIVFLAFRSRRGGSAGQDSDTTAGLEAWVTGALESELCAQVTGLRAPTAAEKKPLGRTLRGDPDVGVVSAIEEAVKSVTLEYLRYAHENDAEVTLRVAYENGSSGTAVTRILLRDLPSSVRRDFETKSATRVFRPWAFPWARSK